MINPINDLVGRYTISCMELWHVMNRGVEKRKIFLDDRDRFRFVHGLALFNNPRPANNTTFMLDSHINDLVGRYDGERLVDIHGWILMPDHYHILLSEKQDGGITKFLQKLNVGFSKYFNERHRRVGGLFQGRTKKVLIESDRQLLHILNYVHFNALDFSSRFRGWRSVGIRDRKHALERLRSYRWSSYMDYSGRDNFPWLLTKDFFSEFFDEKNIDDYMPENAALTLERD